MENEEMWWSETDQASKQIVNKLCSFNDWEMEKLEKQTTTHKHAYIWRWVEVTRKSPIVVNSWHIYIQLWSSRISPSHISANPTHIPPRFPSRIISSGYHPLPWHYCIHSTSSHIMLSHACPQCTHHSHCPKTRAVWSHTFWYCCTAP